MEYKNEDGLSADSRSEQSVEEGVDSLSDISVDTSTDISTETPTDTIKNVSTVAGGIVIKKNILAIAAVLVAVLTVGSLFLGMWINRIQSMDHDDIDPGAKDYHSIYANACVGGSDEITIPGYSDVFFSAGERDVQMVLLNPDGNPCYFRFSLILSDTGEELYRSGLIPPGMAVTEVRLSRALDAGEYGLRIRIESFSLTDRSEMNGADMETRLNVSR